MPEAGRQRLLRAVAKYHRVETIVPTDLHKFIAEVLENRLAVKRVMFYWENDVDAKT